MSNHQLRDLNLLNFRNVAEVSVQFGPGFNSITGPNGSGKTTLLDAVHYLCMCKSFINAIDTQNIRADESQMAIWGNFQRDEAVFEQIHCGLKREGKKTFKRDKKEYPRLTDHIGRYPCVVIAPTDADLITGGSEVRRRFIDSLLSQTDRTYLDHLVQYNRALQHRNSLLRHFAESRTFVATSLDVWDMQLERHGSYVHEARKALFAEMTEVFNQYYQMLCNGAEQVAAIYESQLNQGPFAELIAKARDRDRAAGISTVGPHKDDVLLTINDHLPLRRIGSQGQQKTALVSLKLAQFSIMTQRTDTVPVLLLDDVFDKLDLQRVSKLIDTVGAAPFGQVFITHTDQEAMIRLLKGAAEVVHLYVEAGALSVTRPSKRKIPLPA